MAMTNVTHAIKGDVLTITVNLSERHGPSSTGKTVIVASSHGAEKLNGKHLGTSFALNVYTKPA